MEVWERSGRSNRRRKVSLPGRQAKQRLSEMLDELPQECNVGRKANAKGHRMSCSCIDMFRA